MKHIFKLSLRGIRAHLGRLALTLVAISLGVGFVSGSFIIKDSLGELFNGIIDRANADIDARIQPADIEFGEVAADIPDTLVAELQALPEVGFARGSVFLEQANPFVPLDDEGEAQTPTGPPILTFSWTGPAEGGDDPFSLDEGVYPGPGEVAIDYAQADVLDAHAGDTVTFTTPSGQQDFVVSGIIRFEGAAGAWFVLFDLETAQVQYDKVGIVDAIELGAATGTTEAALVEAVRSYVPPGNEVLGSAEVLENDAADFNQILDYLGYGLLGFAAIAVFVSLFIIYNTFAILVSQRIQEIGMLRAIGASGNQVLLSIVFEALIVGVIGSAIGIPVGIGVAAAIKGLFQSAGGFPETGTVITFTTVWISILVGVVASVVSAIGPAFRASRISPIAAMRNEASSEESSSRRTLAGAVVTSVGVVALLLGLFGGLGVWWIIALLGVGVVLTFVGISILSSHLARPVSRFIGRAPAMAGLSFFGGLVLIILGLVATIGGIVGVGGSIYLLITGGSADSTVQSVLAILAAALFFLVGVTMIRSGIPSVARAFVLTTQLASSTGAERKLVRLARENVTRSPQRTAATATALMIGLALVTTVGVLGQSLKSSFASTLQTSITADLFIYSEVGEEMPLDLANQLEQVEGISTLTRFRADEVKIDGTISTLTSFDTGTTDSIVNLNLVQGELRALEDDEVYVFSDRFEELGLAVGDQIDALFGDGSESTLTIAGVYEDKAIVDGDFVIDIESFTRYYPDAADGFIGAKLSDAADNEIVRAEVDEIVGSYSQIQAQNNQEIQETLEGQIDGLLLLINGMLGLALVVAFFGVVNTIVLSVLERTREIGLMRAIGMTRDQLMTIIRLEALIVCLFGALLGLLLGVLFAWVAITAIPDSFIGTVSIPWVLMALILMMSSVVGVLAAFLPARRAAKMDVLEAIAS